MPSGVSDYGSQTWLAALFGLIPVPGEYFIALCSDEPGTAMDGAILASLEPTDPAYARQPYYPGLASWAPNGPYLANLRPVTYPTPALDWGYLTHFALCTAATAGQVFAWGALLNPQYINATIGILIPAGALVLGLHSLDNTIAA